MEFEDIRIVELYIDGVKPTDEKGVFIVPYLISASPRQEWINFFWESIRSSEREARKSEDLPRNIKVFDRKITFKYTQKEENLGDRFFEKFFENSIEYANKKYRESEKERLQIEAEEKQKQEQKRRELDDLKKELQKPKH